jgi:hypothetical protein
MTSNLAENIFFSRLFVGVRVHDFVALSSNTTFWYQFGTLVFMLSLAIAFTAVTAISLTPPGKELILRIYVIRPTRLQVMLRHAPICRILLSTRRQYVQH